MSGYHDNDYVNITLSSPIEISEGITVTNVEVIPVEELHIYEVTKNKIDFNSDPLTATMQVIQLTARNGETGVKLPKEFFSKLKFKHLDDFADVMGEAADPED